LISGNPELGLRSFLFREEHDGQTPRPASYSKVRAGYFNRLLGYGVKPYLASARGNLKSPANTGGKVFAGPCRPEFLLFVRAVQLVQARCEACHKIISRDTSTGCKSGRAVRLPVRSGSPAAVAVCWRLQSLEATRRSF
jgi:hypothetical protein